MISSRKNIVSKVRDSILKKREATTNCSLSTEDNCQIKQTVFRSGKLVAFVRNSFSHYWVFVPRKVFVFYWNKFSCFRNFEGHFILHYSYFVSSGNQRSLLYWKSILTFMRALSVPTDQERWDCTAFIYISYDISGL